MSMRFFLIGSFVLTLLQGCNQIFQVGNALDFEIVLQPDENEFSGKFTVQNAEGEELPLYSVELNGSNGTVSIVNASTGEFTYSLSPDTLQEKDTFTYVVSKNGIRSNVGTVTVRIKHRIMSISESHGGIHTCAISNRGSVKCWGLNEMPADAPDRGGALGLGDVNNRGDGPVEMGENLPSVDLGKGMKAVSVSVGPHHSCAVLENGQVKCWGYNYGSLGLGDVEDRGVSSGQMGDNLPAVDLGTGRTAKAVAAGFGFTCALLDNNQVKCWGANSVGQLGLGDTDAHGSGPNQMGDNLPTVNLGTGRTAKKIIPGHRFVCAVLDNNKVKCWGENDNGQLGLQDKVNRGAAANQMGDNLPTLDFGVGALVKDVSSGIWHSCALLTTNEVKCWGMNPNGELGRGDTNNMGGAIGQMGNALRSVNFGLGKYATAISVGGYSSCALLNNNDVKCWGRNSSGELGQGDTTQRGVVARQMGDNLLPISFAMGELPTVISTGSEYSCVLFDNKKVKCWGLNTFGQLGVGDNNNRGDNAGEMGESLQAVSLW